MKARLPLLIMLLCLLAGCSSTDIRTDGRVEYTSDDVFYIASYYDPRGVSAYIRDVLLDAGFATERVYNSYHIPDQGGRGDFASGFFISPDLIVTNYDIIGEEGNVTYYYGDEEKTARTVYANERLNLALLQSDDSFSHPSFQLSAAGSEEAGETLFALGYGDDAFTIASGTLNGQSSADGDRNFIQFSSLLADGMSGGPVVNKDFKVLGMADSAMTESFFLENGLSLPYNVSFALRSEVLSFLAGDCVDGTDGWYVTNLEEAENATVSVPSAFPRDNAPGCQYYIDYSYTYSFKYLRWTLTELRIRCYDVSSGAAVATAFYEGSTFSGVKKIARKTTELLIEGMLRQKGEDERQ